jgi:hypothetical protein
MRIRLATQYDLPALMALVRRVVPLMLATGNRQWDEGYPNESVFERDIALRQLWVAEAEDSIRCRCSNHGPGAGVRTG